MDILVTDSQVRNCVYNNTIRLVPEHVMSIFRHGYFAVIKLYTKRFKYKTTPFAFNLHFRALAQFTNSSICNVHKDQNDSHAYFRKTENKPKAMFFALIRHTEIL